MRHYTKSRSLKRNKQSKTRKQRKSKSCKRNCRTKDCGHTPFLYGGAGPNSFQKLDDLGQNLAYTGKAVPAIVPNPHFAYTGKGGFSGKGNNYAVSNANFNLANAYPIVNNQYVPGNPTVNWLNSNSMSGGSRKQKKTMSAGGSCSNNNAYGSLAYVPGQTPMKAGGCGCAGNVGPNPMQGQAPISMPIQMKGGSTQCALPQKGGNGFYKNPLPYPNGLVGTAWTPKISSWPGVNGVSGDSNYFPLNKYSPVDISREMVDIGAAKPFMSGGSKKNKRSRKHRGGYSWSNSFGQDFVNLGRNSFYNMNSAFNALKGVPAPTNPLPWKEQLVREP